MWYNYHVLTTNVPTENWKHHGNNPLVVVGLLEHENKMSVLNFVLRRTSFHDLPIKSKVMYVCVCVCMYVCIYVCMCVYTPV